MSAKTIRHMGEDISVAELARRTGINVSTLYMRHKEGKRNAELVRPVRNPGPLYACRPSKAKGGRKVAIYYGAQKPMDLTPRQTWFEQLVAQWNQAVAPREGM